MGNKQKDFKPEIYGLYCACDDCFETYGIRSDVRLRVQYVGQAMYGMHDRFKEHYRNRARDTGLCANWIRSHRPENIRQVRLQGTDLENIDVDERYWIDLLGTFGDDSRDWGKNADRGGQGWVNREISDSTREKHRVATTALWQDPEYVAKQGEALRAALSSPEYAATRSAVYTEEWRAQQSARMAAYWADPEWRQAYLIGRYGPDYAGPPARLPVKSREFAEQAARITGNLWEDPGYRARVVEAMNRPEVKQRQSELHKAKWDRPGYREHHSAAMEEAWTEDKRRNQAGIQAALWEDPEYRESQLESIRESRKDPDYQAKQSANQAALWEDPKYRARQKEALSRGQYRRRHPDHDGTHTKCPFCADDRQEG